MRSILILVILMVVAACRTVTISNSSGSEKSTSPTFIDHIRSSPESTTDSVASSTHAAEMARRWTALGIDDYTIVVSIDHPNGMGGGDYDAVYSFEVRNGQIRECAVTDRGANAELADRVCDTATSPVSFLLSLVERLGTEHTSVRYDAKTRLPATIRHDDPDSVDEEYEILLIEFSQTNSR